MGSPLLFCKFPVYWLESLASLFFSYAEIPYTYRCFYKDFILCSITNLLIY
jgi:hypothetical protein